MAFADPQSVTYNAVAKSLNRVSSSTNAGRFYLAETGGNDYSLELSHQYGKRTRRMARLNVGAVSANPFATGLSSYESSSFYLVVDTPATYGIVDPAVAVLGVNALTAWLTASTNANALKLVQGQN